jgi:hypothetical protein
MPQQVTRRRLGATVPGPQPKRENDRSIVSDNIAIVFST